MSDSSPATFVDKHRKRLAETTLDLLSFDTQNPPGDTTSIVDYAADRLSSLGLRTRRIDGETTQPGLVAWFPSEPAPSLVFNGHLDTVPFDEREWSVDPLGERDGDLLYGRGATDMKGAVAAMLLGAQWFATRESPPAVGFALTSNEEVAGDDQLTRALSQFSSEPSRCLIGEMSGTPDRPAVAVADKGSLWLTLSATGESAHGSRPVLGRNAIDRLYTAVDTLRDELTAVEFELHPDVQRLLTQSVAYYAPKIGEQAAWELFERPTVNLGVLSGGESVNSVPATATAELDVRLTASVSPDQFVDRIRSVVGGFPSITIESIERSEGTYEAPDAPLVEAVTTVGNDATGRTVLARSATGGGDAKTLRRRGIETVEFALGTETAHATDERTTVEALCQTATVYASLPAALRSDDVTGA